MSKQNQSSRRKFLQQIGATSLLAAAAPLSSLAAKEKAEERTLFYEKKISSADKIRLGVIGYGVQGHFDLQTALKVPGVELAGICDLYTGRFENAKEQYGNDLFTTRNYKELLDKTDIDAVIIATTDCWHARITKDALAKGKAVYCEKPMVYKISEGPGCNRSAKEIRQSIAGRQPACKQHWFGKSKRIISCRGNRKTEYGKCGVRQAKFYWCMGIYHTKRCKCRNNRLGRVYKSNGEDAV